MQWPIGQNSLQIGGDVSAKQINRDQLVNSMHFERINMAKQKSTYAQKHSSYLETHTLTPY